MDKKEIEDSIRKYLRGNHTQHPRAFPETLAEVVQLAKILAESYWVIIPRKGVQGSMGKEYSSSTAKEYKGVLEVTAGLAAESLLKSV